MKAGAEEIASKHDNWRMRKSGDIGDWPARPKRLDTILRDRRK
jgi:hypothetical protein